MPIYKSDLSVSGIDALLENIENYSKNIDKLRQELPGILAKKAEESISENISAVTDKDGNEDVHSGSEASPGKATAFMHGSQAAYLEYGTGINGESYPHPLSAEAAWAYNSGAKIRTLADGTPGWMWFDSSGERHFTHGIEAQKCVFNAAVQIREEAAETARKELEE